jgi:hypothetical protein
MATLPSNRQNAFCPWRWIGIRRDTARIADRSCVINVDSTFGVGTGTVQRIAREMAEVSRPFDVANAAASAHDYWHVQEKPMGN